MKKEQRQRALIEHISQVHQSIQIAELVRHYDCSEKTIRRNLQDLIQERNAPWFIHDGRLHIDQSQCHAIEIHGYWFNKQEIESLFALNQIIEQLSPGILQNQLEPFKVKLNKLLQNEITGENITQNIKLIEIAGRKTNDVVFQTITQALIEQKQLAIEFWNRESDVISQRSISPLQLVRYKDNWKLDAWCHQKNALRTFSLEAIQQAEITRKNSQKISTDKLKSHYETSYGIFAGQANKKAKLKFSPYIARWVKYEQWHPKQTSKNNKDGSYQLTIPYNKDQELIQDILKYGEDVVVIEPQELQDKIKQKLKNTLEMYSDK